MTKDILNKGIEVSGKIDMLEKIIEEFNTDGLSDIKVRLIFDVNTDVEVNNRFSRVLPDYIKDDVILSIKQIVNNNLEHYKEEFEDLCCCENKTEQI